MHILLIIYIYCCESANQLVCHCVCSFVYSCCIVFFGMFIYSHLSSVCILTYSQVCLHCQNMHTPLHTCTGACICIHIYIRQISTSFTQIYFICTYEETTCSYSNVYIQLNPHEFEPMCARTCTCTHTQIDTHICTYINE